MTIRNKINLSITISFALAVLTIVLFLLPAFREIKNSSQDLISQRGNLVSLEAKTADLEKFKIFSRESREITEKTESLFVSSKVPVEFISFLEQDSQDCQLKIEILPISVARPKTDPWPSLTFQISATGLFPDFLKFLERLESSPYLIEVQKLRADRLVQKETFPTGQVKASFTIKVFSD